MQANKSYVKINEQFKPFELVLRIQSQEEAQALYAMFNYVKSNAVLDIDSAMAIKKAIGEEFYIGCRESNKVIGNGVTYGEYYK